MASWQLAELQKIEDYFHNKIKEFFFQIINKYYMCCLPPGWARSGR